MSTGLAGGITQILGGKRILPRVLGYSREDSASIDIVVGVEYGVKIPEIAKVVQDNVKRQ